MSLTTDPTDPRLGHGVDAKPGPQNKAYLVLSEEERRKGFVRPLRRAYRHVGLRPRFPLQDLTKAEKERYPDAGYVKFEKYPEGFKGSAIGRYWTATELANRGCGSVTTMAIPLCETYARNPHFYGATYCCGCSMHLPVAEFVWEPDGEVVGS